MKKNIQKIGYTLVALLAFGAVLSFSSIGKTFAAQDNGGASDNSVHTSGKPAIIHRGGGHQYLGRMGIAGLIDGVAFDALSPDNYPAVFEKPDGISLFSGLGAAKKADNNDKQEKAKKQSFLTALGTSWVGGDMFIGVPRDPLGNDGFRYDGTFNISTATNNPWIVNHNLGVGNPLTAPLQKINVWKSTAFNSSDGNVLATNLIHNTENDQVCVNKDGSLVICGSFACTGNTPDSHSVMCQGDNTGLTVNTPKTLVAACTTDTKCEFECMGGYHYDASTKTCELNTCIGTIPANATLCSGDDQGLDQDTNYTLVNSCTSDDKCETVCDTSNGYHYDPNTQTCVEDVTNYHWDTGDWGQCSQKINSYCDGQFDSNYGCSGNGSIARFYVTPHNHRPNPSRLYECTYTQFHFYQCGEDSTKKITQNLCNNLHDDIVSCDSENDTDNKSCNGDVAWGDIGFTNTFNCFDAHASTRAECESINSACTWHPEIPSVRTRVVECKDDSNQTVDNQFCIDAGITPDIDVNNDHVPDDTSECTNGTCGFVIIEDHSDRYYDTPTVGLCNTGTAVNFVDNGDYSIWDCLGSNGGDDITCGTQGSGYGDEPSQHQCPPGYFYCISERGCIPDPNPCSTLPDTV